MKKFFISALVLILMASCAKESATNTDTNSGSEKDLNEVSLVQTPHKLENSKGELLTVTYFAKGKQVAVKLEREGQPEEVLTAKTISTKGEPVFSNEKFMWEGAIGEGGKLSDGDGNGIIYLEIEEKK